MELLFSPQPVLEDGTAEHRQILNLSRRAMQLAREAQRRDAMARGLSRLWLAPCLFMTLMLGPIGLLAYHLARTRAHQPLDVPILAPMSKAD